MKKIISTIICGIILFSALALSCFADIPTDGFALEDYGQKHFYVGDSIAVPPVCDGVVREGEYNYAFDPIIIDDIEEFFDDRFFFIDGHDDSEYVNIYVSYDDNNIYLAMEIKDHYPHVDEKSSFDLGCGPEMEKFIRSRMCLDDGNGNSYVIARDGSNTDITDVGYFSGYRATYDDENDLLTYEIAYDREELGKYFGMNSYDKLYFRAIAAMYDEDGKVGEAWLSFQNSELMSYYVIQLYRYPHVLHLGSAPETEPIETEPVETEPVETEPVETEPTQIEVLLTEAPKTEEPVETEPETEAPTKGGCGGSVSIIGTALVLLLGATTIHVKKRN